jgi:hypothetical protein
MLPIYTLFKVDKPLDDKDKDVQDNRKECNWRLRFLKYVTWQIESKVKEKVSAVADKIVKKLKTLM